MIDFIEYVVAELKSKRLSKANAVDLVRQFSCRSSGSGEAPAIHPLLYSNTSDLSEQRYSSLFTGEEFFLADHQVKVSEDTTHKVLPGVAYLEMARAAIEDALPERADSAILELHNTVWAQPIVVSERKQVNIALLATGDSSEQIDYEIFSQDGEQEIIHCQGRAVVCDKAALPGLDLEQLKGEMGQGQLEPDSVYAACARMGVVYGPSFHTIRAIHRGSNQILAHLRLPAETEEKSDDYVLHPSLMDGALQACVGLMDVDLESSRPRLPFALDSLRIVSPCSRESFAWVRYAPGSQATDKLVKLDIDLCDEHGNICVQMRGFSSRVLFQEVTASAAQSELPDADAVAVNAAVPSEPIENAPVTVVALDSQTLAEKTQDYLRKQLAGLLKLPSQKIDPKAALENYGIDSILAMKLTNQLEQTFGSLPKTLFFEYQTIRDLAEYFATQYSSQLTALFALANTNRETVLLAAQTPAPTTGISSRRSGRLGRAVSRPAKEMDPIAIIGLSGRYPEAIDLEAYWRNLRDGKDCITEVPKERWDWREYFSDDRTKSGHHYSKWGGFIAGVDEFDPLFFNISPAEAELIDPQERLFLQHVWMAIEDASYTRASLQMPYEQDLPGQVGVYVGVMYTEYQLFGAEASAHGKRMGIVGSFASVANRVSYALNLHGPSMTLDTMCSSSLTAIHTACQDLKSGRTSLAIAGGVNVTIHPNKYLILSGGQFISSDGHCQSFGKGGDGYIPGEGVGVVILKRLSEAERDGDHIYGIIRGSALNHGGKTNGYSVPNPQAQATAIGRALAESKVNARHISYIEAHGTGTKLGDPIEIAALNKAFQHYTQETEFCLIGSVKSNIGHCESAAGIAGLTKVLLQMQHQQIAPSLHSAQLNPHIDFPKSPFVVNQELKSWEPPVIDGIKLPRIASISSFGAGGSNAHMIVEEYRPVAKPPVVFPEVAIVLSARTPEQLRQKARELLEFMRERQSAVNLSAMAYTLQMGREAMEERLALLVNSVEQLMAKLQAYLRGEVEVEEAYQGQVKRNKEALALFTVDADLQQTVDRWVANRKLSKLLELWVKGLDVDWSKLYGEAKPQRMSLPTYPFAKERYWIDTVSGHEFANGATAVLHPLLHSNTSDLSQQSYRSTFTGDEFFLADHRVAANGHVGLKVLPGVAYLEMARAAIEQALPLRSEPTVLELRNIVWAQPVIVADKRQVGIAISASAHDQVDFEIYSLEGEEDIIHSQGHAIFSGQPAPAKLDIERLRGEMGQGRTEPEHVYAAYSRRGLLYGPSFQAITAIDRGNGQALAHLRLPAVLESKSDDYVLHPSLMDGALQAAIGLTDGGAEPDQPRLPFALDSLCVLAACTSEMFAWVRYAPGSQATDKVVKLDIDLCDEHGNLCVKMQGLSSRMVSQELSVAAAQAKPVGSLFAAPVWQASSVAASEIGQAEYAEHHVIVCELPKINADHLGALLLQSQCLSLHAGEEKNIAQRYSEYALTCFERIQSILQSKPQGKVLVQIVAAGHQQQALLAGLSGLLKTAALENPQVIGQLILISPEVTTEDLGQQLHEEKKRGASNHALSSKDPLIRYEQGVRQVLRWQEVAEDQKESLSAFKDDGAYLITGGLGGLGILFAKEILARTSEARVILTGRGELSAKKQALLGELSAQGPRVSYRQLDLGNFDQVKQLIAAIKDEHGQLNGILHSAGMIADSFILKKTSSQFSEVLAPKVTGTYNLDQASQDVELDFFVLFSSGAGALGNLGQADYATANAFMDHFAAYRNRQVAAGQRHGRTRSINWPLWQSGGMGIDAATQKLLRQTTGMQPMQTATGMQAFYRILVLPCDQMLVAEGNLSQMRNAFLTALGDAIVSSEPQAEETEAIVGVDSANLAEKMQDYLRKQFSELMKLPAHKIDPHAALENYGIDSVLAMKLTNLLEQTFGSLSKTLFFEYQTIAGLAGYFVKKYPAIVQEATGLSREVLKRKDAGQTATAKKKIAAAARPKKRFLGSQTNYSKEIAIVGLAGRYPQAENLEQFWTNLKSGRDCITEIPPERWNNDLYFDADRNKAGKTYSKWGGFVADVDKFDPLFFNISPREAELIDPQERLFLETAWQTIEDAGYSKESIYGRRVGVFVGVMWGQYELFGAESVLGGGTVIPSSSHGSIANRVSYFFDFHGPSMALDTMCSSSLTAIHLACEELRKGEIESAIAGGVNLTIHPYKYLSLSQGKFAASDGRCRSFGQGGDGYVPGEGVGAVLLKTLESALRDGDQIYAVIKASTVNHGGKTNGYTVPNPNAQADLILDALKKANIDPGTLSYIETHGTGTSLGDPIEITGLSKAFEGFPSEAGEAKQFCPIGSVKSNIGHLESAAGIAAVTKALLQIKHNQLVPSIHAAPLNPNINFADSPFYVQTELAEWNRPATHPRRVGVSSFGAGGSNAHLILEEFRAVPESESPATLPEAFLLSARDQSALYRYAERIAHFLKDASGLSLANIAYTSQRRTPMDARLVVIASSLEELRNKLDQWIALRNENNHDIHLVGNAWEPEGVFYGNNKHTQHSASNLIEGATGKAFVEALLANRDLEKIARLWIMGVEIDWFLLDRDLSRKRVSLPTYPFAQERCWINQSASSPRVIQKSAPEVKQIAVLEPSEAKQRTYYWPQWTARALAVPEESRQSTAPILMLDTSETLYQVMKERLGGETLLWVKPGNVFQEVEPNIYVLNPEREEQFQELVETLRNRSLIPSTVLHHSPPACNLDDQQQVAQHLGNGVYTLLYLCKALMKEKLQAPLKILSVFSSHSETNSPLPAAIGGFLKTLTLENPKYCAKVIDLQGGTESNSPLLSEKAEVIWNEICDNTWNATQEIRYLRETGDERHVRYVGELVSRTLVENKLSSLPLRQNGVYVITGGLGGLGLIFAEYLAKNFQARLILLGRSAPNATQTQILSKLKDYGAEIVCLQADTSKLEDMQTVVREAKARFAAIHGVIHVAGVNRDAFILKKNRQEMEAVLASKVYGTINLDLATREENLDLFILFSSIAGVMGNIGQSDYAYGNHFLDSFAESRENLRRAHKRSGRTLSINWPLWEAGGMSISREDIALLEKRTGLSPLPTEEGIRYWEDFLRSEMVQGIALYGAPSKIAAFISQRFATRIKNVTSVVEEVDFATLIAKTEAYLKALIGEELKLSPDRIGSLDRLESFGIDSVMISRLNARLEKDLGELPKTLLYEHETVRELATFLMQDARGALTALVNVAGRDSEPAISFTEIDETMLEKASEVRNPEQGDDLEQIAIVGIHGYYPHSATLDEYWENLKQGKDLIDLVPPDRWDYAEFYHPDPAAASDGKIYCKWGGFLEEYDKFDAPFFNISSEEARLIDPQERLFLESVWAAIEDAGYTRDSLKRRFPKARSADVGVFVGVTTNSYHLWAPEERTRGNIVCPSAMPWSIANRVSYFFDFNGPSMPIDTACSSSLVAVHLACESLKNRECQVAIAGGVNLYLHHSKYQSLCQRRMLSLGGKCRSYGAGDDGFVPGEGVGTLVLKPLCKAVEHGDRVYAVISASAYDHSGRSNGYSAPNPNSQASLISRTLMQAGIHPESISYIEGHGTGTQLGDSIEIAALTQAFQKQTKRKQFCPIGSVKANIGHPESAAGVAGLAKIILQMKHRQLAPSIYSDEANPDIEFKESPFYLQHQLSEWQPSLGYPRRALINSFGAGGVNACVIVDEYACEKLAVSHKELSFGSYVFTLSAKSELQLREYAGRLLAHLRRQSEIDLASLCYTLQVGREAMEERLAIVVSGANELIERLEDWSKHGSSLNLYRGSLGSRRGSKRSRPANSNAGEQNLLELASAWAEGEAVDWESLYPFDRPRRIALPTYPFARERHWVSDSPIPEKRTLSGTQLHPLISHNCSTLREVSFSSSLSETAFYAVDHKVNEEPIFPGAGFLEMACIAGNIAGEQRVRKIKDIVWVQPLTFRKGPQTLRTSLKSAGDDVEYVISSLDDENETILHSEGRLAFKSGWKHPAGAQEQIPIQELKSNCASHIAGPAYYNRFMQYGLHYGPAFQTIQEIHVNDSFVLSKLKIADHLKSDFGQFILHPTIIDGALQTVAALVGGLQATAPHLPFALDELEILHPIRQTCYAYAEFAGSPEQNRAGVRKFNIRLLNESGDVLVQLKNLFLRALAQPQANRRPIAAASELAVAGDD